ncbi:SDR family NAD(P)-dependent oxidoreductase [Methylobacterium nonmethylotrophicum]|uniref:SDR family NAD(P)-dependent oxidoreductase n=1 Tax=Methylobacterium nonmethylotrophicum TaxID=1141884 RepID=A0A4Z0NRL0_9HYPH|nr:SDR family NAD(P)-dependent oxidoreductase [Methylobacterium nonmethylotrophicum]TGD99048.1 SDR family NAD(P)-dependent oxidoreductase [Methylobacterium nonmethylotrophicum]
MTASSRIADNPHHRRLRERYGSWAVVTGASDGMGRDVAALLAAAGLNLLLVARRAALLAEQAEHLRAACGVDVRTLSIDLGRPEDVARLIAHSAELDVGLLVAAAGFGTSGRLIDADIGREAELLAVNCGAVLRLSHAFGRYFAARGRGGLVLFGSLVGRQGVPFAAHYAASKAYIQSLAEGLRFELAPHGVDVLSVAPGPVSSGFAARAALRMGRATSSEMAARDIVAAFGRRGTVVPGGLGRLLTRSLRPLPRGIRVRIMAGIMKGMVDPHERHRTGEARPA